MSASASGRTWDDASSPAAARLARRYEALWRHPGRPRPDPADFLPADPAERPGALLALLRADLNLRWEAREPVRIEWYRRRYDGVEGQVLVALLYEEFCLREEAGEHPDPAEYDDRFPEEAAHLRRILDIHGLLGAAGQTTTASLSPEPPGAPLPEAGQTIAGFRLIEELGRGAFARVFRAEERQLADRPVALKVARRGSREPQTLARLQHTYIVPVYSYLIDPATELHLLCMPYFGRVTLAQVLAAPEIRGARSGSDLVAALDRLEPSKEVAHRPAEGRRALAERPFARAIAWWGARLAEALQHAHDRGVLHRDIKPSNVLITADGLPMLLDFNLAQGTRVDPADVEPAALGGTVAYMAPEHLEALAEGSADRVDGRADLYALGVVLFEALAGARPFATPGGGRSVPDALLRMADERRAGAPSVRRVRPEVPPALDAVVRHCLDPDPADRYATAAELAADLQAVADDGPLRFAREPQPSRSLRWLRRNRRRFAVAATVALALAVLGVSLLKDRVDLVRREAEVRDWIDRGKLAEAADDLVTAMNRYETAARLAQGLPELDLFHKARERLGYTAAIKEVRDRADTFFKEAKDLRFRLLGFDVDSPEANHPDAFTKAAGTLNLFFVRKNEDWAELSDLTLLDPKRKALLPVEVNELLFLWAIALADPQHPADPAVVRQVMDLCDRAPAPDRPNGPWDALRARYTARRGADSSSATPDVLPDHETSVRTCFQWGVLREQEHRRAEAIAWLERATELDPGDFWSQFYLAYCYDLTGQDGKALQHAQAAVALERKSPHAHFNRARLYRQQGDWEESLAGLDQALTLYGQQQTTRNDDFVAARLELGVVLQTLGDTPGAREAYCRVIKEGTGTPYSRAARLNLAKLDAEAGDDVRALAAYNALLDEDPHDSVARLGGALLALGRGEPERAEADLTILLDVGPRSAEILAIRAMARLALGRPRDAAVDAAEALALDPSPGHQRLWRRALLASDSVKDLRLDDPDAVAALPVRGPALWADLRRAANQLRNAADALSRQTRAVLLSALNDPQAKAEATQVVASSPSSVQALLVLARIRRRAGDRAGALADVQRGLDLDGDDLRLWELRGVLQVEVGQPRGGLEDLNRALLRGAEGPSIRGARARALAALGRDDKAISEWTRVLACDPEDPRAYLDRARAYRRLGQFDQALADLEQAAGWADDRADLLAAVALSYTSCLPARPDRLPRVIALMKRACTVALGTASPQ